MYVVLFFTLIYVIISKLRMIFFYFIVLDKSLYDFVSIKNAKLSYRLKISKNNLRESRFYMVTRCRFFRGKKFPLRFPFKTAVVKPVHKQESYTDINNYKSIAILSSLSRIIETSMCNNIMIYLSKIVNVNQFGRSTHTAIFQVGRSWRLEKMGN